MMDMRKSQFYMLMGVIALLLIAVPFVVKTGFWITLLYTLFIYIALAESWNIVGGFGGQVFLGTAAFFGWGAYACAMLCRAGLPFTLCVLLAGLTTTCLAVMLVPTFKLRGVYFVIGSLFIPEIMKVIVLMLPVTGGAAGIVLPVFYEKMMLTYYFALSLMLVVVLTSLFLDKSRIGMALRAIRDDQDAAEMFGINSTMFKFLALLLTAIFCGMAGGIHAFYITYIEPHSFFDINWSVVPVFMVLVGGLYFSRSCGWCCNIYAFKGVICLCHWRNLLNNAGSVINCCDAFGAGGNLPHSW